MTLLAADRFSDTPHKRNIDKRVHWIGRRLDEDHRNPALGHAPFSRTVDVALIETVREPLGFYAKRRQGLLDQYLGAAIQWTAVQDRIAGPEIGQAGGGDRGHAGREHEAFFSSLVDGKSIFDDFQIRVVEAGIYKPRSAFGRWFSASGGIIEEVAS